MFQVEFYEKEDGDIPVEKFLNSLDTVSYTHLTLPTTPYV